MLKIVRSLHWHGLWVYTKFYGIKVMRLFQMSILKPLSIYHPSRHSKPEWYKLPFLEASIWATPKQSTSSWAWDVNMNLSSLWLKIPWILPFDRSTMTSCTSCGFWWQVGWYMIQSKNTTVRNYHENFFSKVYMSSHTSVIEENLHDFEPIESLHKD